MHCSGFVCSGEICQFFFSSFLFLRIPKLISKSVRQSQNSLFLWGGMPERPRTTKVAILSAHSAGGGGFQGHRLRMLGAHFHPRSCFISVLREKPWAEVQKQGSFESRPLLSGLDSNDFKKVITYWKTKTSPGKMNDWGSNTATSFNTLLEGRC